jgi:DNA-binding CsgD family transcriptional regulator
VEPLLGPIGITFAVRVLVAQGDLSDAACLAASLTPLAPVLPRTMPAHYWAAYLASLSGCDALPPAEREAAEHRGHALALRDALPLAQQLVWALVSDARPPDERAPEPPEHRPEQLSAREREVLALLVDGASNPEIGRALGIAGKTVMHHTMSIYRKLGVRGRAEAAAWAVRSGGETLS